MEDKLLLIKETGEYLERLGSDPYFSEEYDNSKIVACINSSFRTETVSAFINPPCDEEGFSRPELAIAFVLLNDGTIILRTNWGNEYNLADCLGESVDTVHRVIKEYYQEKNTDKEINGGL